MKRKSTLKDNNFFIHLFFILFSLICVVPFIMLISVSFSSENAVLNLGFSIFPREFTTAAYDAIFSNPSDLVRAVVVTAISTVVGSFFSILVMAMLGYTLARPHFMFKKFISTMLLGTMLFGGGLIPTYIINTQVYHLGNNILLYFLNGLVAAPTVFIFRTFFQQLPDGLIESAELDGATEMQVLTKIVIPLSTACMAAYMFMQFIGRWNDYSVSMYYMTDKRLFTLQYLLQLILNEVSMLSQMAQKMGLTGTDMPNETLKFAMCVITTVPTLIVFPYFQKYFSKGMTLGSVKG